MMEHQECKTAIIEFGDYDKSNYKFIKQELNQDKHKSLAHTYWYPENITNEEANQEILDLCEHYKNVAILLPIPAHVHLEVLKQ